jgi:hypothetical protein
MLGGEHHVINQTPHYAKEHESRRCPDSQFEENFRILG